VTIETVKQASRDMTDLATRSESGGFIKHADRIVRPLGPRNEPAVQGLLRRCGQSSRNPVTRQMILDLISQSTEPAITWTAGLFVANELTGVTRASVASREGHVEAMLFVDEEWRRQGIGSMLLRETVDWSRRCDATALRLVCDRTDWPMRHLAEKFGARLDLVFGQIVADIPLVQQ
jgi:GNAT superfamily N-acetyltransferase